MVWVSGSQGALAPALVALFRQADEQWPNRSGVSDGTIGDLAHASRSSDHNPKDPNPPGWVDAADLTEDFANGPDLPALWDHLIATRDPRVKYLIYEGRIVKSYRDSAGWPAWEPQPYTGLNAHKQHLHISVTPEGRGDTSPWFPSTDPTSEEDEMTPEQAAVLASIHAEVTNIRAAGINTEARVAHIEEQLAEVAAWARDIRVTGINTEERVAALAALDDADLTDEQVQDIVAALPAAVKQALREGTG